MKQALLIAIFPAVLGCAAPVQYEFDNSHNFDSSMDEVWPEIISFFVENNLPISTIEQASGLIMSNVPSTEFFQYADCASSFLYGMADLPAGNVNLFVRERSPGGVSVMVNTHFQALERVREPRFDNGMVVSVTYSAEPVECVSMGILENALFDRIDAGLNMPTANF